MQSSNNHEQTAQTPKPTKATSPSFKRHRFPAAPYAKLWSTTPKPQIFAPRKEDLPPKYQSETPFKFDTSASAISRFASRDDKDESEETTTASSPDFDDVINPTNEPKIISVYDYEVGAQADSSPSSKKEPKLVKSTNKKVLYVRKPNKEFVYLIHDKTKDSESKESPAAELSAEEPDYSSLSFDRSALTALLPKKTVKKPVYKSQKSKATTTTSTTTEEPRHEVEEAPEEEEEVVVVDNNDKAEVETYAYSTPLKATVGKERASQNQKKALPNYATNEKKERTITQKSKQVFHSQPIESNSRRPKKIESETYRDKGIEDGVWDEGTSEDGVPGEAGVDYPTLAEVPTEFDFTCESRNEGFYADVSHKCQVTH